MRLDTYLISRLQSTILGNPVRVTFETGEVLFWCPFCSKRGLSRGRKASLYVNPVAGAFKCHRCNFAGSFEFLSSVLKLSDLQSVTDFSEQVYGLVYPQSDTNEYDRTDWLEDSASIFSYPEALDYLYQRRIGDPDIIFYNLSYSPSKKRIIFPNYGSTGIDYWTARTITKEGFPKYLAAKYDKNEKMFNFGHVVKNEPRMIICEGPISSISAGRDSIAIYGNYPTDKQMALLRSVELPLYVAMEIKRFSLRLCDTLIGAGKEVYRVVFKEHEDANNLGTETFRLLVNSAPRYCFIEAVKQRMNN